MGDGRDFHRQWMNDASARYTASVARGEHDGQCEWRAEGYFLCHCSKRKREAAGYTEPPGELIHQYPLCPRCLNEVSHDGDSFQCLPCKVTWNDGYGAKATFTDDYGVLDPDGFLAKQGVRGA